MSLDFFGFDEECALPYCSLIILIIIIFGMLITFVVVFIIVRRRIRERKKKIHQKPKRAITTTQMNTLPAKPIPDLFDKKPKKIFWPKTSDKDKKIVKIPVPQNSCLEGKNKPSENIKNSPSQRTFTFEGKKKNNNLLLNRKLYLERLMHKKQMYADDPSVQFENISNLSIESRNNSLPNLKVTNPENKELENEEQFIKIVLFQREDSKKGQKNFGNLGFNKNFEEKEIGVVKFDE